MSTATTARPTIGPRILKTTSESTYGELSETHVRKIGGTYYRFHQWEYRSGDIFVDVSVPDFGTLAYIEFFPELADMPQHFTWTLKRQFASYMFD
ncbi:hypothetical protein AB0F20_10300 [Streptomyces goshikiensis]|uniref:hypothetical protein n=1 Tax=Streptomyces goshikiensis TaxID=1942 RepID=UPI0033F5ED90